ncbi:ATP-binding protein [Cryocola sp. 340MFSha3.1]|uniref:ATP-binding protein n=1 Tax=Cryocola sp. 340MFSha3.1 TaxID=1169145 RepID=UPI0018CA88F8
MFRLYLTGAPGSGKSTAGRALAELVGGQYVSYGDLLTKNLGVSSQEELRRRSAAVISPEDVVRADEHVREAIGDMSGDVVVDSHVVTRELYGFRAIPFDPPTLRAMRFTHVVCLLVPGAVIHDRIARESGGRPLLTPDQFDQHSALQSSFAVAYSHTAGVPAAFLEANLPVEDVVATIAKFVGA